MKLPAGFELRLVPWPLGRRFRVFFGIIVLGMIVGYLEEVFIRGHGF